MIEDNNQVVLFELLKKGTVDEQVENLRLATTLANEFGNMSLKAQLELLNKRESKNRAASAAPLRSVDGGAGCSGAGVPFAWADRVPRVVLGKRANTTDSRDAPSDGEASVLPDDTEGAGVGANTGRDSLHVARLAQQKRSKQSSIEQGPTT